MGHTWCQQPAVGRSLASNPIYIGNISVSCEQIKLTVGVHEQKTVGFANWLTFARIWQWDCQLLLLAIEITFSLYVNISHLLKNVKKQVFSVHW